MISDRNQSILINKTNIEAIELYTTKYKKGRLNYSFVPWSSGTHYFYRIYLQDKKSIIITCILDDQTKILEDTLKQYQTITIKNRVFPYIKNE
jgi:hypothetical protein